MYTGTAGKLREGYLAGWMDGWTLGYIRLMGQVCALIASAVALRGYFRGARN